MFQLSNEQINELAEMANTSDRFARMELANGVITSEDDYTSAFVTRFRDLVERYSTSGLSATSFRLPKPAETAFGCDAAIVLQSNDETKVAIFEAKWPRWDIPQYPWDSFQRSSRTSHFSHQLDRQARASGEMAKFEMFYSESLGGNGTQPLLSNGSTCVLHSDALGFKNSRPIPTSIWSQHDLADMLRQKPRYGVGEIVRDFARCLHGEPFQRTAAQLVSERFGVRPRNVLEVSATPLN